jgi:magnesium-transporting ATPase (P-type)
MSQPHTQQPQQAVSALKSSAEQGLTAQEAATRLNRYGKNNLVVETPCGF